MSKNGHWMRLAAVFLSKRLPQELVWQWLQFQADELPALYMLAPHVPAFWPCMDECPYKDTFMLNLCALSDCCRSDSMAWQHSCPHSWLFLLDLSTGLEDHACCPD